MLKKSLSLAIIAIATLTGCTTLPQQHNEYTTATPAQQTSGLPLALPPANLEADILYSLLVAELAGQQQRYDIMLKNYVGAAKKTNDPGLAEHATQIAISLKAHQIALESAQLWHQTAPDSGHAKQVLAATLILNQQPEQAIQLLEELLASGQQSNIELLAANGPNFSPKQRDDLITHLEGLLAAYPNNPQLLFTQASLLQLNDRHEEALNYTNKLHRIAPGPRSLSLQARLNHQLGHTNKALTKLNKSLKDHPQSRSLQILYAQILLEDKQLLKALEQFTQLSTQYPQDHQLKLTLAVLQLKNGFNDTGKKQLLALTNIPEIASQAHYYLGQAYQQQSQTEQALQHYKQVTNNEHLLSAHQQIGLLLLQENRFPALQQHFNKARKDNPEQSKNLFIIEAELLTNADHTSSAITLLNTALKQTPNDINLLYNRAIAFEKTNHLNAMEHDLRAILSQQPNNAVALNMLGYTLADRTTRYPEALKLITRANELSPNNPAITDSLGWVQFRLGNIEQAIELLEQAFSDFKDHEVAAHLGEALWTIGQHQRARQIWSDALQATPDSAILKRVINRLSPELK